jgi:ribosome recycling factor
MPVKEIVDAARDNMSKAVDHVQQQLAKVRTGRASASMLDRWAVFPFPMPGRL